MNRKTNGVFQHQTSVGQTWILQAQAVNSHKTKPACPNRQVMHQGPAQ